MPVALKEILNASGKFKLSEVDEWIRSGGASDENNTEDKEQA